MRALLASVLSGALLLSLGGCGLKPLYAGGGSGPVAVGLSEIEVAPIPGRSALATSHPLRDRLGVSGKQGPKRYRLEVRLDDEITGLAIRRDDSVARERRTLRARYQLVEIGGGGEGQGEGVVLDATAGSDAGIDVVGSEYATIAAEATALERLSDVVADQIVTRIALYMDRAQPAP